MFSYDSSINQSGGMNQSIKMIKPGEDKYDSSRFSIKQDSHPKRKVEVILTQNPQSSLLHKRTKTQGQINGKIFIGKSKRHMSYHTKKPSRVQPSKRSSSRVSMRELRKKSKTRYATDLMNNSISFLKK